MSIGFRPAVLYSTPLNSGPAGVYSRESSVPRVPWDPPCYVNDIRQQIVALQASDDTLKNVVGELMEEQLRKLYKIIDTACILVRMKDSTQTDNTTPLSAERTPELVRSGEKSKSVTPKRELDDMHTSPTHKKAKTTPRTFKKTGNDKNGYERRGGKAKSGQAILLAHIKACFDYRGLESGPAGPKMTENFEDYPEVPLLKGNNTIDNITDTEVNNIVVGKTDGASVLLSDGVTSVHSKEAEFAKAIGMRLEVYETQKRRCFLGLAAVIGAHGRNNEWNPNFGISQAQQVCNADVNKVSKLFQFWKRCGWLDCHASKSDAQDATKVCFEKKFGLSYSNTAAVDIFLNWERRRLGERSKNGKFVIPPIFVQGMGPGDSELMDLYHGQKNTAIKIE